MPERSNGAVLKTADGPNSSEGSNPSPAAESRFVERDSAFSGAVASYRSKPLKTAQDWRRLAHYWRTVRALSYLLDIAPEQIDVGRFERLTAEGRDTTTQAASDCDHLIRQEGAQRCL